MRLIDADELKTLYNDAEFVGEKWHVPIRVILANIDDMPTVDEMNICKNCRWARIAAGFMKHGRWEEREVIEQETSNIEDWQSARCSVCGKYHTTPYLYMFKDYAYCPNCGAYMDEASE